MMYSSMETGTWPTIRRFVKHHWLTVSFVLGFCTDVLLLNQIDNIVDNLILLFYATLATCSLLLFYVGVAQKVRPKVASFFIRYMPMVMQYSFGGLLSGMLIFYGRSGDWFNSAPYLLLIIGVIVGNELVSKRSDKLLFSLVLYFIGLFSYVVLVVPVILGTMGDLIFIISGFVAVGIVTIVGRLLHRIVPNFMRQNTKRIIVTIGFTYVGLNTLYFANIIPPIPLSLTELEIVQSVTRTDTGYRVVEEMTPWWQHLPFVRPRIHPVNDTISCFARVYAPTRLSTDIYHRWEYKNAEGEWVERLRLGYPIQGSNVNGYRGYTTVTAFQDGEWRCIVETERGQVLGHRSVLVESGPAGELVTRIK